MLSVCNPHNTAKGAFKKNLCLVLICAFSLPVSADESASVYSLVPAVDCVINPYRVADIASPVAGIIDKLHVERSQKVAAGQIVAELEAHVERANVELARYRAGVKSEIGVGQVNMSFDSRRKKRAKSLAEKQSISDENAEQVERDASLSKWKLRQAREISDIRSLELRRAEQQLQQKMIKAPFEGYILDTFKYSGEYVEEQAIVRLAQLDPLVVEAIVPMENFGQIQAGMRAEVRPETLSNKKLIATVSIVDRIGDTSSNTFGVKLEMPNPDHRIPAGLKCVVKFLERTAEQNSIDDDQIKEDQTDDNLLVETVSPLLIERASSNEAVVRDSAMIHTEASSESVATEITSEQITQQSTSLAVETMPKAQHSKPESFLVMTPQGETDQHTRDIIRQLREAGVEDLQEMDHGPHKGNILLGLYNKRAIAEQRQRALQLLDIQSFIKPRSAEKGQANSTQNSAPIIEKMTLVEGSQPEPVMNEADTDEALIKQVAQLSEIESNEALENEAIENETIKAETIVDKKPANAAPKKITAGYLVMTRQGDTGTQTGDIISQLEQSGVEDFDKMNHGPYKGHILLGLYSTLGAAEKRQQTLHQLGFIATISDRATGELVMTIEPRQQSVAEQQALSPQPQEALPDVVHLPGSAIHHAPATSFLVLAEQGKSSQQATEIIDRLRASGVVDMHPVNHGVYRGQVMLGLYSTLAAAERRQQALAELGFITFISERY